MVWVRDGPGSEPPGRERTLWWSPCQLPQEKAPQVKQTTILLAVRAMVQYNSLDQLKIIYKWVNGKIVVVNVRNNGRHKIKMVGSTKSKQCDGMRFGYNSRTAQLSPHLHRILESNQSAVDDNLAWKHHNCGKSQKRNCRLMITRQLSSLQSHNQSTYSTSNRTTKPMNDNLTE